MANDEDKREYKGPGKFTAGVGRGLTEEVAGAAIGTGAALALSKNARAHVSSIKPAFTGDFIKLDEIAKKLGGTEGIEKGMEKLEKGRKTLAFAIGSLALVGLIHGVYKGVKNASAAKQQVADLNAELDSKTQQLEQQKGFVAKLTADRQAPPTQGATR